MLRTLFTIAVLVWVCPSAQATIVLVDTVMGSFTMRLFDTATPLSTENFLNYVNDGDFEDSFFHRNVPGFVLQGGAITFESDDAGHSFVPIDSPVLNEPGISNIRGTIAYAKQGGDPNSATSQWFSNLAHNTANLDNQNGGFTVFSAVLGDGMDVVDAIADLLTLNVFIPEWQSATPVPFASAPDGSILKENLVIVNEVRVLDLLEGDFNFDGTVDAKDFDKWAADFGRLQMIGGDFDDNKNIDGMDFLRWQSNFGAFSADYSQGDADGDGDVDSADFAIWEQGFGSTVDVAADGDGSATVDGMDFLRWQVGFGQSIFTSVAAVTTPEPSAVLLAILAALFTYVGYSGRRRISW